MSISISSLQYSVGISPVVSVDHTPKRITIICCLHGLLPSLLFSLLSHSGAEGRRGRAEAVTVAKKGNAAMATWGRRERGRASGRARQPAGKEEGGRRRGPTSPARFLEFFEDHRKVLSSEGNSSTIGSGTDNQTCKSNGDDIFLRSTVKFRRGLMAYETVRPLRPQR